MATYITKKRQSLSCSARWFSDIPAMEKSSADKTHLGSLGGRPETGATPVFHRWREWLQLMKEKKTEKLKERSARFFLFWTLQCLQMKPSFINTGHIVSKF